MNALYWFALVVGAGMYLFSAFAGHGDGTDAHVGGDVHDGDVGHHGSEGFRILSLRNATYFLFAFGVSGVALTWLWQGRFGLVTALVAALLGVVGGAISSLTFGWLRKSESGDLPGDSTWLGTQGRVTIPLSRDGTGKVLVSRAGREHELLARPLEDTAPHPERWISVMVVEMRHGVALVAPNDTTLDDPDAIPGDTSET
jgi:hypothetical protein